ncbi:hypothetical protein [Roseimaritima sediminicola]|uniref:hypothetical protein n=1 Tax=Roseimaritima sediminicola TaxID=2662066 RepID=UPI0012982611|nr:hypothetical protein [Roseimaritima sediminicola]
MKTSGIGFQPVKTSGIGFQPVKTSGIGFQPVKTSAPILHRQVSFGVGLDASRAGPVPKKEGEPEKSGKHSRWLSSLSIY